MGLCPKNPLCFFCSLIYFSISLTSHTTLFGPSGKGSGKLEFGLDHRVTVDGLMFSILATSFLLIKLDFIKMTPAKFELNFGIIVARFRNLFRRIACLHARNHSLGFFLAVIVAHSRREVNSV